MKNRREFLKTTCPTVAFAFFGVSLIQACSSSEEPMPTVPTNSGQTNTDTAGVTQNGNTITIDLNAANFSGLATVGSWMNLTSAGVLLLRVSSDTIRAFDNCCPHQGTKTQWSYGNNTFNCANHGNSFGTGNNTANCNSGATNGDLVSYTSSISGNTLTINKA
ncbi:MAG: Rieske 2Fe-2S domain-containing protein [Flavobacteriaceae bacterium]|nr:Rieske 2Fe-2S domain-containing protein [Flavobacteriaceae bacterium]MDG1774161.1 Rieske 2Fe-2S domain-containing protein [Flavobacteriaceae bacterium]